MRRLSDDLGVAVTSIYWHVGNRDAVLDGLVDRLLDRMETLRALGDTPHERMASLARQLRSTLLERQHLVGRTGVQHIGRCEPSFARVGDAEFEMVEALR